MVGGAGDDVLRGGSGSDSFRFVWSRGDTDGESDVIDDFDVSEGDRLHLVGGTAYQVFDDDDRLLVVHAFGEAVRTIELRGLDEALASEAFSGVVAEELFVPDRLSETETLRESDGDEVLRFDSARLRLLIDATTSEGRFGGSASLSEHHDVTRRRAIRRF